MHRSSKRAVCGTAVLLAVAVAPARAELAARPAFASVHPTIVSRAPRQPYPGIAPTIVPRGRASSEFGRGTAPTLVPRARGGYGYGYADGGPGGDTYHASDLGAPAGFAPPEPGPPVPPPFIVAPPTPCPQIIEIGGGLAHKVKTRVITGASVCGR